MASITNLISLIVKEKLNEIFNKNIISFHKTELLHFHYKIATSKLTLFWKK